MRGRLRRSVDARLIEDGTILLLRGPAQGDIELEGDGDALAQLLAELDGTRTVEELGRELAVPSEELDDVIAELQAAGVVDDADVYADALSSPDRERFDRQLDVLADQLGDADAAAQAQNRLRQARVCLLGLGGLGSWVAWGLVTSGVGTIVGVDGDLVELSNLNRQILYSPSDVGRRKADVAGEVLRRFDPQLHYLGNHRHLTAPQEIGTIIEGADVVVTTIDHPPHLAEHWVQEAAFAAGIPVLAMTQHPPFVRIGPLYVPGRTGCLQCQETRWRESWERFEAIEGSRQVRAPSSTFGPACGVVGALAAAEVVAMITGVHEPATLGREHILDMSTLRVEERAVPRVAGCPRCDAATDH